ncbi:unnamed protein product [Soboliphyme baturini]|uniref:RING-CH-type domain-containing protein n=1 Tax=Soboliphyme baturini TaxID=241478 RepID=A0A183IDX0_9BILA|nr:unnamed protein product [Soboliphyme baturini]
MSNERTTTEDDKEVQRCVKSVSLFNVVGGGGKRVFDTGSPVYVFGQPSMEKISYPGLLDETGAEGPQMAQYPTAAERSSCPSTQRVMSGGSAKSGSSTTSASEICRICHCEAAPEAPLIAPCYCSGTLKYVHQKCLQQWIKSSQTKACEVCRFSFIMQTKVKPFRKWEKLDISLVERRKIFCSVAFHIIAITCVVWSLYVLIDRTAEEIREGQLDWPFWTKLVVVAIGFTGGLVFMYVQCKMYVQLLQRWKAYNKVIYVGNCPDFPKQNLA